MPRVAAPEKTFRDSPRRSVVLEVRKGSDGERRVVCKHFHSSGSLSRLHLRDRQRARRETRILTELFESGVPVPRPLGVERTPHGWQAVLEWIPDTVELEQILRGNEPWPVAPEVVARRLGELLAAVHAAGLDHPDLHPGNVLVNGEGRVWLIDFHQARPPGRSLSRATLERDLAALAARGRETVSPRFRARFFLGYLGALSAEQRRLLPDRASLLRDAEARGRDIRRATVFRFRTSWLRKSGNTRVLPGGSIAALRIGPIEEGSEWVLRSDSTRELEELWFTGARLAMHGIPCASPFVLDRRSGWASFVSRKGELSELEGASLSPAQRRNFARGLGELIGALCDRGIGLKELSPATLLLDTSGAPVLAPTAHLTDFEVTPEHAAMRLAGACDLAPFDATAVEKAACVQGFTAAFLGAREERQALRRAAMGG